LQRLPEPAVHGDDDVQSTTTAKNEQLEAELRSTREHLQTTIEELETTNEELKSANEELQSTNEELQSTNEELETSKEELQSLNEELITVNTELEHKLNELSRANDDMVNLLASTNVATLFLDSELRIKRFTPATTRLVNLLPGDEGRSITHFASEIVDEQLVREARSVLETLQNGERMACGRTGSWYSIRIAPYRTVQNVIDGVVITFLDVTEFKRAEIASTTAKELAEGIVATVREPLIVLDHELRVVTASRAFHEAFDIGSTSMTGQPLADRGRRQWSLPHLDELLRGVLAGHGPFDDFEMTLDVAGHGTKKLLLNARLIRPPAPGAPQIDDGACDARILLAIEDVTPKPNDGKGA
jgi:two-component system CheB/CheR fusion protein